MTKEPSSENSGDDGKRVNDILSRVAVVGRHGQKTAHRSLHRLSCPASVVAQRLERKVRRSQKSNLMKKMTSRFYFPSM